MSDPQDALPSKPWFQPSAIPAFSGWPSGYGYIGALLFTTDGTMAQELLHPSRHVWKHYLALVLGVPTEAELERLRRGIMLDDGMAQPAKLN